MEMITFQCMSCDGDFDLKLTHLIERPNALRCPHCGAKPTTHRAHAFSQALDDFFSATAGLLAKFRFELAVESDELPEPYSPAEDDDDGALGSLGRDEDDDDEDDEDDDEDDDEFDDDDEFEDLDDEDDDDDEEEDGDDDDDDDDDDERY